MRENSSYAAHLGDISWLCGRTWPPHAVMQSVVANQENEKSPVVSTLLREELESKQQRS